MSSRENFAPRRLLSWQKMLKGEAMPVFSVGQWDAARAAFSESLEPTEGMPLQKYQQILELLGDWDNLTPFERREKAGGNQSYWYKKFALTVNGGKKELLMKEHAEVVGKDGDREAGVEITSAMKRCSHQERMWDDIKEVHLESAPRLVKQKYVRTDAA